MKKRFIIHIGPHKTGSTYIQKTLSENKSQLKESGIEYSAIVKETHMAHHDLAENLYTKKYDLAKKILTDIKVTDQDILVSSENFDRLDIADVGVLAQSIKEYHVEIIFVKRRLEDLLISSWQESIKHGGVESWSKYSLRHLLAPFSSEVLDNSSILKRYVEVFGKDKIKIIDFDKAKESGQDICDLLFEAINVPELKGIGSRAQVNKSMPYSYIEIIRILNILYRQRNKENPHHFLRERFISFLKGNKNNELIEKVKKVIEQNLEVVNLNNKFIFNHLNNVFIKEYEGLVINPKHESGIMMTYELPNESWYMESDILKLIECIYLEIVENNSILGIPDNIQTVDIQ